MESNCDPMLEAFFGQLVACYGTQAEKAGETVIDCNLAGHLIRLRFAGQSLRFLAQPLSHLTSEGAEDVTPSVDACRPREDNPFEILILCGDDSEVQPPKPPWDVGDPKPGDIDAWRRDRGNVLVNHVPAIGFLQLYDRHKRTAVYWVECLEQLSFWEIAAPFRTILRWWTEDNELQIAHAAAVGREGNGVLLVGGSGQGKSTTAATCLDAGMDYVSDDYVLLSLQPHPTAYCLYNSSKLHTHLLQDHFPHWQDRVVRRIGPESKSLFFVHRSCPQQLKRELRLIAVVCPQITDREQSRCVPTSRLAALRALGPSTVLPHASHESASFSFLARMVRQLPPFRLELGGISTSPPALDELLRQQSSHVF